ncbi:MAG: hypothetical protein J7K69_00330 [Thermotogae bacterium]|nr:hypothetical protein [Thermotogota bacterium]
MEGNIKEIVNACLEDENLLEVIKIIASMNREEKDLFRKKVNKYFFSKSSPNDVMAYKFYQFVLLDDNAEKVLNEVMKVERK